MKNLLVLFAGAILVLAVSTLLAMGQTLTMTATGGPATIGLPPGNQNLCTTRIAQLTGGYDVEGKSGIITNDTVSWGVAGVDLGANCEFNGRLYFFFGDVVTTNHASRDDLYNSDLIAYTTNTSPENGLRLVPVMEGSRFYPFGFITNAAAPVRRIFQDQTPTGAFSHGSNVYVFFNWHDEGTPHTNYYSSVARSSSPDKPTPFMWLANLDLKFSQVAPWVVRNSEIRNLPSDKGNGLMLFGQSGDPIKADEGWVHLAWLPLPDSGPDFSQIRYYRATNSTGNPPGWTTSPADATYLFKTRHFWTSLSVGRIAQTGKWILLYQRSIRGLPEFPKVADEPEESIVARVGAMPWDFFGESGANEFPIFNPVKDAAYRIPVAGQFGPGRGFIHRGKLPKPPGPDGLQESYPTIPGNGFAYGAYLLNRYSQWEAPTQTLTIYYLLSTGMPYQIQLMRSAIKLVN